MNNSTTDQQGGLSQLVTAITSTKTPKWERPHKKMTKAMLLQEVDFLKQDLSCIHTYLDKIGVPREDKKDTYSIVGRIKWILREWKCNDGFHETK